MVVEIKAYRIMHMKTHLNNKDYLSGAQVKYYRYSLSSALSISCFRENHLHLLFYLHPNLQSLSVTLSVDF